MKNVAKTSKGRLGQRVFFGLFLCHVAKYKYEGESVHKIKSLCMLLRKIVRNRLTITSCWLVFNFYSGK